MCFEVESNTVMRESFHKAFRLAQNPDEKWYKAMNSIKWLDQISTLLRISISVAETISRERCSVTILSDI